MDPPTSLYCKEGPRIRSHKDFSVRQVSGGGGAAATTKQPPSRDPIGLLSEFLIKKKNAKRRGWGVLQSSLSDAVFMIISVLFTYFLGYLSGPDEDRAIAARVGRRGSRSESAPRCVDKIPRLHDSARFFPPSLTLPGRSAPPTLPDPAAPPSPPAVLPSPGCPPAPAALALPSLPQNLARARFPPVGYRPLLPSRFPCCRLGGAPPSRRQRGPPPAAVRVSSLPLAAVPPSTPETPAAPCIRYSAFIRLP